MKNAYTVRTKKRKATNLSLDAELVKESQELKLNLSRILEESLRQAVKDERGRRWVEENKEGFESLRRVHEKYGIWNEDEREW